MSVTVNERDGLMRVQLDLQSSGNKLTPDDAFSLLGAFARANELASVRAVLLEGGAVFCAGASVGIPSELASVRARLTKPLVAGVQGAVLGVGAALLAAAHVVVAAQGTSFGLTEIREAGWPLAFDAIADAIGRRRATELAMTGRIFSTPEALQMGLIHEVAPAFEFDDRAEALALHLSRLDFRGRLPL